MSLNAFNFGIDYRWEHGIDTLIGLGWPGLVIGGAIGFWVWRQNRITSTSLSGLIGLCLWIGLHLVPI